MISETISSGINTTTVVNGIIPYAEMAGLLKPGIARQVHAGR